jgi:serine/threonine-protein kinase HipA
MIRVWSDRHHAGVLDRLKANGSTFAYDPTASAARAVSLTMPVRTASWNTEFGLAPIFDMNLPEGELREHLRLRFAKAVGTFDDFDLLGIVGRTQIGRIRYSAFDADLSENVPFQSIDDILRARRGNKLFDDLVNTFAEHSGLSGVQPKVMIRGKEPTPGMPDHFNLRGATHIVKLWNPDKFPDLAANEFFCLTAARTAGLDVPTFELSDDGTALIVERFDLRNDAYLGFEDFCVLNGLRTDKKYAGGYETRLFKSLREFMPPASFPAGAEKLFRLFALNCAIRNGDAHLKNFGIVYPDVMGAVALAPVYDLVTTVAYIPKDGMALTLGGSTNWPSRRKLVEVGQTRADLSLKRVESILEATADAMASVAPKMRKYFKNSDNAVGARMDDAWQIGVKETLGFPDRKLVTISRPKHTPRIARSDNLILEHVREKGGAVEGTQKAIAAAIGLPESTLNAAIRRLADRRMISRSIKRIELMSQEI